MNDFEREYNQIAARTDGEWRLPPGLQRVPFYARRKLVPFGEPTEFFAHLHKVFGKIAHYRFLGAVIIFVNEPAWINEILVNQAGSVIRERTGRRMKILMGEGLVTSDDPRHMQQRRIIAPTFHRRHVAGHAEQIVAHATALASLWSEGQEIDIAREMMQFSHQIIAKIVFGTEVTADVLSVRDEVKTIIGLYLLLIAFPRLNSVLHWPIPGLKKFRRSRVRLDALLARMIADRRTHSREELEQNSDLLSMLITARVEGDNPSATEESPAQAIIGDPPTTRLLAAGALSNTEVRDEVLTIFFAGYETVSTALTWAWYLLSQNPDAAAKMYAEVDQVLGDAPATAESFSRLKYTEMVFAEALRLYPPIWVTGRQSIQPVELGPYRFPPGTTFLASQYVMHRSPEFWDEPLAFRPERHTSEAKAERPRFVYFPFGGGGRQCIGEGLVWMEGVLTLATIAQRWRLHFVPKHPVIPEAHIILRPKFPMIMRVERTH